MAGRRKYRGGGKSAYKFTSRRKSALRKAQLISARKRKKNNAIKVGVLVGGAALAAYGGHKYGGKVSDVASSVKRSLSFNNPNNSARNAVQPDVKLGNVLQAGATNAQAARQAPPVNSPNMNNNSTPAPNKNTGNGPSGKALPAFGGIGQNPKSVQQIPQAEAIIDPQKPQHSPFPAEHMPSIDEVMNRINYKRDSPIDRSQVTRQDVGVISLMWSQEKLKGVKIKGQKWSPSVGYIGVYTSILDQFGLETSKAEKARTQGKA